MTKGKAQRSREARKAREAEAKSGAPQGVASASVPPPTGGGEAPRTPAHHQLGWLGCGILTAWTMVGLSGAWSAFIGLRTLVAADPRALPMAAGVGLIALIPLYPILRLRCAPSRNVIMLAEILSFIFALGQMKLPDQLIVAGHTEFAPMAEAVLSLLMVWGAAYVVRARWIGRE